MPSAESTYILNWMTLPKSWTFHWVVCRALSTSNSVAERNKHTGYRSTLLFITKPVVQGSLIHLTHYTEQEEQFLRYTVTHDKTRVHCTTHETKKAYMMWKHPSYHTAKTFKEMPSVKKNTVTLFWEQRGTLLVNFLDHGNTLTAEYCCDTPKMSEQVICCKMSGLSCQGVIHPTSQPDLWLFMVLQLGSYGQPPYGPDLMHSNFHLFGLLKKHLASMWYATYTDK